MIDIKLLSNDSEILYNEKDKKFRKGLTITFLKNFNNKVDGNHFSSIINQICCSNVKNSSYNWHYFIPPSSDLEHIKKVVKELQQEFDNISFTFESFHKGDLLYDKIKEDLENSYSYYSNNSYPYLKLPFNNSELLKSSFISYQYKSHISKEKITFYEVLSISFLYSKFSEFCVKIKIRPTSINIKELSNRFIIEEREIIIDSLKKNRFIYVSLDNGNIVTEFPTSEIEYDKINYNEISENIVSFFSHYDQLSYLNNYYLLNEENIEINVLNVLYSQKRYRLQPYIIHHFIRASFSSEFDEFFDQYFKIKSIFPNLYFWNIIFLCLFNSNYYYYYWLTSQKLFRFTNKEEMTNLLYNYEGDSTMDFFLRNFDITLSQNKLEEYIKLYNSYDFDLLVKNLSINSPFYVVPTNTFKKRSTNFELSSYYQVLKENDDHYLIRGDNFVVRWYNKKNFKIT